MENEEILETVQPAPAAPEEQTERLFTLAEVEEAVAQARDEAYLRGRNEKIEQLMAQPGPIENPVVPAEEPLESDGETFLSYIKPSVWDY